MNLSDAETSFLQEICQISSLDTREKEVEAFLKRVEGQVGSYCSQVISGHTTKLTHLISFISPEQFPYARVALLAAHKERLTDDCYANYSSVARETIDSLPENILPASDNMLTLVCSMYRLYYKTIDKQQQPSYKQNFINATKGFLSKIKHVISLTPIHWLYAQACVDLGLYDLAVGGLDGYFPLKIDKELNITYHNFLGYFTCMATSYIKTDRFKEALQCCHEVITIPATIVKDEMDLAVRRAKLLSLIVYGKPYEFPKHAFRDLKDAWSKSDGNPAIFRNNSFFSLNKAFADLNGTLIDSIIAGNIDEFRQGDCELLLPHVYKAVKMQSIKNITITYLAMSIDDITAKANISNVVETEQLLTELIFSGVISAKINKKTNVVNFADLESTDCEIDFEKLQDLAKKTEICMAALANVRKIQAAHLSYVQYVKKNVHVCKRDGTPVYPLEKIGSSSSSNRFGGMADRSLAADDGMEGFDDVEDV